MSTVVVKIGTSSITDSTGMIDDRAVVKLALDLAAARDAGHSVILVSSGAVAAGLPPLGLTDRPNDIGALQAVAAVGQPRLFSRLASVLDQHGIVAGQVLLTSHDFIHRTQYLLARETLARLLELAVLPVVNENDTVADDEIRYGDNDRLAALVSHLVRADLLVLLTDTAGMFTADPRHDADASLIEEIRAVDAALEAVAGGAGSTRGSGGMASKLAAAKIAAWSGVTAVIAAAEEPDVVLGALAGRSVGTVVQPRPGRLPSRKLWIAFARGVSGRIVVDDGARHALAEGGRSLLPVGVTAVEGTFGPDDTVEIVAADGTVFAKGLVRHDSGRLRAVIGRRTDTLDDRDLHEVVHRDDLVVLP